MVRRGGRSRPQKKSGWEREPLKPSEKMDRGREHFHRRRCSGVPITGYLRLDMIEDHALIFGTLKVLPLPCRSLALASSPSLKERRSLFPSSSAERTGFTFDPCARSPLLLARGVLSSCPMTPRRRLSPRPLISHRAHSLALACTDARLKLGDRRCGLCSALTRLQKAIRRTKMMSHARSFKVGQGRNG